MANIEKLELLNDAYFGTTTLTIFKKDKNVSVIYGKNGSGKTSISNGINEYLSGNENYSLLNKDGKKIVLNDTIKNRTFVFNEEYIDKKVKLSGDEIGAIILFGDTGNIESDIKDLELKISQEKSKIQTIDIEKYNRKGDISCIDDYTTKIKQNLQANWALRQQKIRKSSKKSPVTESIIEEMRGRKIPPSNSRKELLELFDEKMKLVDTTNQIEDKIPEISISDFFNFNEEDFVTCLNKEYKRKEMSHLAQNLLTSFEHYKCLNLTKEVINTKGEYCPVCLRPIDKDYSEILSHVIDEAFDDTVKNAKDNLDSFILNYVSLDLAIYEKFLDASIVNDLKKSIDEYNNLIDKYQQLREQKFLNIFKSVNTHGLGLEETKKSLVNLIDNTNLYIKKINEALEKNRELIEELIDINKSLASIEIKDVNSLLTKLKVSKNKDLKDVKESETKIKKYESEIIELRAKEKDVHVAMEEINKELSIIFSSKNRLKLIPNDTSSKYYVESKGKKVKLNKLSTGERNLIALIYFFEEMKNECKKDDYFRDEYFIVIDDPISSFDYENKLGVYSYLNKMIRLIFNGNVNSQMVILSHERDVVYYLIKMLDKFHLDSGKKLPHVSLRINGKVVGDFKYSEKADYTYLLSEAFAFASIDTVDESFESKGNELRKLVEMYATFNYKIGVNDLFTKKEILQNIEDEELKNYYSNSMIWMPLNADSHTQELALQYPNFDTFDLFSEEEQIKVARDIICYLYLIHKNHITAHLGENEVEKIKNWIDDIRNNLS